MKFIVILCLLASTRLQTSATDSEDVESGDGSVPDFSFSQSASISIFDRIPCVFRGGIITHGQMWHIDLCTKCRCENGSVSCETESCETELLCQPTEIVVEQGQCCPHCQNSNLTGICSFRGTTYQQKQQVYLGPCTLCTCEIHGNMVCHIFSCPSEAGCDPWEIVVHPDVCCPLCPYKLVVESVRISLEKILSFDGNNSGTVRFSVHVSANNQMSSRIVRGEQMWQLSAWMSTNKDGLGKRMSKQQNIFNEEHAAKPFRKYRPGRFNWVGLRYRVEHGEDALKRYLCVKFKKGKDPRPLHDLPFTFHPADYNKNNLVACIAISN